VVAVIRRAAALTVVLALALPGVAVAGGFLGGLFAGEMLGGWGGQDVFVENSYYGDGGDFSGGGDVSGGGDF
jgi:hypothetical protein